MGKLFLILLFFTVQIAQAENYITNEVDSLSHYSLKQLERKIKESKKHKSGLVNTYAETYLKKAKAGSKLLGLIKGYYFVAQQSSKLGMAKYSDSIIATAKGKSFGQYTAFAYYIRGKEFYKNGKYTEALNDYVRADKMVTHMDDVEVKYWIKHGIGLLKYNIGDNESAIEELSICLTYYEKKKLWNLYGAGAYTISEIYRNQGKIDTADYYIRRAQIFLKGSQSYALDYLSLGSGLIAFHKKDFEKAIRILDSVNQRISKEDRFGNVLLCQYYLGKSKMQLGDTLGGISHFKTIDSLHVEENYTNEFIRDAYAELIAHATKNKNIPLELAYVRKLSYIDSLSRENLGDLQTGIMKKYDVPKLLAAKDSLIVSYVKQRKIWIVSLIILFMLVGIFLIINSRRKKFNTSRDKMDYKIQREQKVNAKKVVFHPPSTSRISEKDIAIIKEAFVRYEHNQTYTKNSFNKNFIRKDTNINDHYITDYLRDFIGCSLPTYINNKRIALAFRKYTMQGMAETVGYGNVSTFKRAFRERTGLRPLEFLEKYQKKNAIHELHTQT